MPIQEIQEIREPKRCGAKTRNGTPCQHWAMPNGRCRLHGGKSLKGPDSPSWKDGKYSKYLPRHLLEGYQKALREADPSNVEEIALLEARIGEAIQRLHTGEGDRLWKQLQDEYQTYRAAKERGDGAAIIDCWDRMGQLIENGADDVDIWKDVDTLVKQRDKLIKTEHKRTLDMETQISLKKVQAFFAFMQEVIQQHVSSRQERKQIHSRVAALLEGTTEVR